MPADQLRTMMIEAASIAIKYSPPTQAVAQADKVYTKPEAAKFLNITEPTLSGYVSERKIPFCKPTEGRVYFLHSDLIDWLREHRTATTKEQVAQYEQKRRTRHTRKGGAAA